MKCLTKTFLKIYNFGQLYNGLSSCMKEKTIFLDRETVRDSLFQLWKLYKKIMRKMLRIIFYKKWKIVNFATKYLPVGYKTFQLLLKINWCKIWKIAYIFL